MKPTTNGHLDRFPNDLQVAAGKASPLPTYTLGELGRVSKEEGYLIAGGILPEGGHLVIGGPYKSGKSWMTLQGITELATGKDFWGHIPGVEAMQGVAV